MVSEPTIMDPVANNPSPLLLLNNMSNLMSIKLDSMNYMLWKLQISAILDAYSMIEHLDGSTQQPRQFIITEDGDQNLESSFLDLEKEGQGITDLAPFNTVLLQYLPWLWDQPHLKKSGTGIKKGNESISSYLQRIKNTRDKLSAVGVLVENEELLHMILKGLPKEFAPFASAIRTRDDSISFEKLSVLLQTEEQSMAVASESFSNSALAIGGRSFNSYPSQHQTHPSQHQPSNPISQPSSQPGSYGKSERPTCQICWKIGHYAVDCYHRMDFAYQGKNPPTKLAAMASASNLHYTQSSETWLTDSGASDHITANASTLNSQTPYQGTEQVTVGNGQNLPIQSIVHKLCLDNNCSCHFDAHKLLIQDLPTGRLLYKGLSKDGVYPINSSQFCTSASSKTACFASSSAQKWELWHSRLGHPSAKVIPFIPKAILALTHLHIDSTPSRNVLFNENMFPGLSTSQQPNSLSQTSTFSPDSWLTTLLSLHSCTHSQVSSSASLDSNISDSTPASWSSPSDITPASWSLPLSSGSPQSLLPTDPVLTQHPQHGPQWCTAMQEEFAALQQQGTWLVAKGFHQQQGVDYAETFSPVIKPPTVRLILSLAVSHNWPLQQLDVKNAFLHGTLKEEVYMAQPQGYVDSSHPHYVCKLHKSIYGLKQAPRAWFESFTTQLLHLGFIASTADSSLFIYHHHTVIAYLLLYVDDIVLTSNSTSFLDGLILQLRKVFDIKDLGPLHYFLGLQVSRTTDTLHVTQTKYASDLLVKHQMVASKPAKTPSSPNTRLSLHEGDLLSDPHGYRSLVGALHYLTFTRPDISFAVHQVCQYMAAPTTTHLSAAKRILRYIKGTLFHGIAFTPGPLTLSVYSDADWAGDPDDRRSTSGLLVYLGSNPITWSAKKQATVSRSSTESEYRALATASAEVCWLRTLLKDLGIYLSQPPILWCDNVSALAIASNPVFPCSYKAH
uniref:Reverse transcriptase Ty1/copia-type domain-containing protein n=1 Tax=Fagus sylvatica TaxID=28930 RepID=A0A2N9E4D6_FAGSY